MTAGSGVGIQVYLPFIGCGTTRPSCAECSEANTAFHGARKFVGQAAKRQSSGTAKEAPTERCEEPRGDGMGLRIGEGVTEVQERVPAQPFQSSRLDG